MSTDTVKQLCLYDELQTSYGLIKSGFGFLQEIDMGKNTFYHLPHLTIASGLERFMKCYIAVVYKGRHTVYPDSKYMEKLGHNLEKILDRICEKFYNVEGPLMRKDLDFIKNDRYLRECIRILSIFGQKGRYYNIDVFTGKRIDIIQDDPEREWKALEMKIEDPIPYYGNIEALDRDYYPRVHSKLIGKMERLIRAIALQLTLGRHNDPGGYLRQASVVYMDFGSMREFGTTDYRSSVKVLQQESHQRIKRSEREILKSKWPTRVVTKEKFDGDWPFRHDRVIIECRDKLSCIVNVEGCAFALNGVAQSWMKIPFAHDAGVAILGKSIGPFIDMALALGKEVH